MKFCEVCGIGENDTLVYQTKKFGSTQILCRKHYQRLQRIGTTESPREQNKLRKCDICGITNAETGVSYSKKFNKYLCQKHYYQLNKHGRIFKTRFEPNEIIEHELHMEIILYNQKGEINGRALISKEHREIIEKYKWCKSKEGKRYYARTYNRDGTSIAMHRLIAEHLYGVCPEGMTVDHINRDGLDNRNENIRYATYSEQQSNRDTPSNNTSGVKGVVWSKASNKWCATMQINGKRIREFFNSFEEAVKQRLIWEKMKDNGELIL